MTLQASLALQGIIPGGSPFSTVIQGFWIEETSSTDNILFSKYLISYQNLILFEFIQAFLKIEAETKKQVTTGIIEIIKTNSYTNFNKFLVFFNYGFIQTMTDFYIKKGDTLPRLESTLKYSNGSLVDLTGATSVKLIYKLVNSTKTKAIKTGLIVNALEGKVAYSWQTDDTLIVGDYRAEWQITFSGGGILTIPNDGSFIEFKVTQNLE